MLAYISICYIENNSNNNISITYVTCFNWYVFNDDIYDRYMLHMNPHCDMKINKITIIHFYNYIRISKISKI